MSHTAQTRGSEARAPGTLRERVVSELPRSERGTPGGQSARVP